MADRTAQKRSFQERVCLTSTRPQWPLSVRQISNGLLSDASIIRHRAKIEATIANARAVLDLHNAAGKLRSAAGLVWAYGECRCHGRR